MSIQSFDEPKPKIDALKLLMHAYEKRHQRIIGGPELYLKIRTGGCGLDYQDFIESDPETKQWLSFKNSIPMALYLEEEIPLISSQNDNF